MVALLTRDGGRPSTKSLVSQWRGSAALLHGARPSFCCRRLWRSFCRPSVGYHLSLPVQLIRITKPDAQMVQLLPSEANTREFDDIWLSTLTVILVVGGLSCRPLFWAVKFWFPSHLRFY